jgi:antitoxin ParD1/3/4/toxin ParE1/3/4
MPAFESPAAWSPKIRGEFAFLAATPGAGHRRPDLTDLDVRFFSVYSFLIVLLPDTKPLQIASTLHGRRDIAEILRDRL